MKSAGVTLTLQADAIYNINAEEVLLGFYVKLNEE